MRLNMTAAAMFALVAVAAPAPAHAGVDTKVSPGDAGRRIDIVANTRGAAERPPAPVITRPGVDPAPSDQFVIPCSWHGPFLGVRPNVCPVSNLRVVTPGQNRAAAYAADYFRSLPLPVPQPKMSAPEGIAGAQHQLDLQIPPT